MYVVDMITEKQFWWRFLVVPILTDAPSFDALIPPAAFVTIRFFIPVREHNSPESQSNLSLELRTAYVRCAASPRAGWHYANHEPRRVY